MTLFLGLEWFSIALYILCAYDVGVKGSLEAGLKYLIVGGFGSAVLLLRVGVRLRGDRRARVLGDRGGDGAAGARRRPLPARRPRDDHRRPRLQGLRRAVPHVDAGRLRGRSDARDGLHGGSDEGGRARARAASADDGVPGRGASSGRSPSPSSRASRSPSATSPPSSRRTSSGCSRTPRSRRRASC